MTVPRIRRVRPPYLGPPRYGPTHPDWGFPPLARRPAEPFALPPLEPRGVPVAIVVTALAGLAALASAAAEAQRYALLLRGRREVLDSGAVLASDRAVLATGLVAVLLGACALVACAAVAARCYRAAAQRRGLVAGRSGGQIAAALIIPVWNLYAAGPVLVETATLAWGTLPRRTRRLLAWWWAAWIGNGLLAGVTIGLAAWALRWPDDQLLANQVELHIVLGVLAALVAALTVALLLSLRRAWIGPREPNYDGWVVAPPDTVPPVRT